MYHRQEDKIIIEHATAAAAANQFQTNSNNPFHLDESLSLILQHLTSSLSTWFEDLDRNVVSIK